MGRNDQNKGKREQKQLIIVPILLRKEENHTPGKKQKRYKTAVMPGESMAERKGSDHKSQQDHTGFKPEIVDDIHSKYGQGRQKQG